MMARNNFQARHFNYGALLQPSEGGVNPVLPCRSFLA